MNFPVASSVFGSAAFGFLALLLAFGFRGSRPSLLLLAGSVLSCLWLGAAAWYYRSTLDIVSITGLQLLELSRNAAWLALLGYLLTHHVSAATRAVHRRVTLFGLSAVALIALYIVVSRFGPLTLSNYAVASVPALVGYLAVAVVGLVLIEQLFRNSAASARWRIKYLCFGLGGLFTYDFYMYADALLFQRINPDLWIARGFVNAVSVPMIALAAARNPNWDTNLFVSRRVVFHSSAILTAGAYLMLMAAAGYYIRAFGGTWGGAIQIALLFSALLILVVMLFSGQLRTSTKRFIAKHFYRNKYEYGEEWLRFTSRLSSAGMQAGAVREAIIEGVAEILDSPGGVLWERNDSGRLAVTMRWNAANHGETSLPLDDPFFLDMEARARVVDLVSEARTRDVHSGIVIPPELTRLPRGWLIVPIMQRDSLLGLVVLNEPSLSGPITAEDIELLRIVGRQAASYLALLDAQERLSDARQFEAFNQLSAFLVHDLKNVVAQLNLIDKNAERHRHNDEFLDDVFNTVKSSLTRMNKMLAVLRRNPAAVVQHTPVSLADILDRAVRLCAGRLPQPTVAVSDAAAVVLGDADQLCDVLGHLIQNAQEATGERGKVELRLTSADEEAVLEVIDDGCGMDQEFVDQRLFRPFDTTKGNAGMGIGVYQARQLVNSLGGDINVASRPGSGTRFTIRLPLHDNIKEALSA